MMSCLSTLISFGLVSSAPKSSFFFFNDTATTEIYTLSLHDALPISAREMPHAPVQRVETCEGHELEFVAHRSKLVLEPRSEEHTSELQSPCNLVCRLLLEKKKKYNTTIRAA